MVLSKIISIFSNPRSLESNDSGKAAHRPNFDTSAAEQRLCPRITFKSEAAPILHIGKQAFKVLDLSKTGVKFLHAEERVLLNKTLEGTIRIFDGTCIHFRGATIREDWDSGVVAVQFMQTEYLLD